MIKLKLSHCIFTLVFSSKAEMEHFMVDRFAFKQDFKRNWGRSMRPLATEINAYYRYLDGRTK